jgi:hypothetical protein
MRRTSGNLVKLTAIYTLCCFALGALLFVSILFMWSSLALFAAPMIFGVMVLLVSYFRRLVSSVLVISVISCLIPAFCLWLPAVSFSDKSAEAFALIPAIILPPVLLSFVATAIAVSLSGVTHIWQVTDQ